MQRKRLVVVAEILYKCSKKKTPGKVKVEKEEDSLIVLYFIKLIIIPVP